MTLNRDFTLNHSMIARCSLRQPAQETFVCVAILFSLLLDCGASLRWTALQIDPERHSLAQALPNGSYRIAMDERRAPVDNHSDSLSEPADTPDDDLIPPDANVLVLQLVAQARLLIQQRFSPTFSPQPDFPPPKLY